MPEVRLNSLKTYLELVESNADSTILFTYQGAPTINDLRCPAETCDETYYLVEACDDMHPSSCEICKITNYAEIHHFPTILFFKKRVLKAQVHGLSWVTTPPESKDHKCRICRIKEYTRKRGRRTRSLEKRTNNLIFHVMNVLSLWSVSTTLNDLWHAQGIDVISSRTTKTPRESWKSCLELKKEEWKATGIMATLMITAATALLGIADHPAPRLLCLASIACDLGSAIGSTTLLPRFESVNALRLAWFEGGALFVLALSAPNAWLRWGIVTLDGALLAILWMSQPMPAKIFGSILVTVQFFLFFSQSYSFRGTGQFFTIARPLTPEMTQVFGDVASYSDQQVQGDEKGFEGGMGMGMEV